MPLVLVQLVYFVPTGGVGVQLPDSLMVYLLAAKVERLQLTKTAGAVVVTPVQVTAPTSPLPTSLVCGVALVHAEYVVPDGALGVNGHCPDCVRSTVSVPIDDWLHAV